MPLRPAWQLSPPHKLSEAVIKSLSQVMYGGTYRVLDKIFKHFGINYGIVDTTDLSLIEQALTPDVKAVLIESPANPLLTITDIAAVAGLTSKKAFFSLLTTPL